MLDRQSDNFYYYCNSIHSDRSILVIKTENIRKVFIQFTCLIFCQVIIRKESKLGIFLVFTKEYMSLTNKYPTKIIWVNIDPSLHRTLTRRFLECHVTYKTRTFMQNSILDDTCRSHDNCRLIRNVVLIYLILCSFSVITLYNTTYKQESVIGSSFQFPLEILQQQLN